ncbi:hypothetical protein ES703_21553 [subsurface metagenome]
MPASLASRERAAPPQVLRDKEQLDRPQLDGTSDILLAVCDQSLARDELLHEALDERFFLQNVEIGEHLT